RRDRVRGSKKKIGRGDRPVWQRAQRAKIGGGRFCSCWGCQGRALTPPTKQNKAVAQRHTNSYARDGSRMADTLNPAPAGSQGARFTTARSFHRKDAHESLDRMPY